MVHVYVCACVQYVCVCACVVCVCVCVCVVHVYVVYACVHMVCVCVCACGVCEWCVYAVYACVHMVCVCVCVCVRVCVCVCVCTKSSHWSTEVLPIETWTDKHSISISWLKWKHKSVALLTVRCNGDFPHNYNMVRHSMGCKSRVQLLVNLQRPISTTPNLRKWIWLHKEN